MFYRTNLTSQIPTSVVQILYETLPRERVILDAPVASVDTNGDRPVIVMEGGQRLSCRMVLGADGVRSVVGASIGVPPANPSGQAGYRGLATFNGDSPVRASTVCQVWLWLMISSYLVIANMSVRSPCKLLSFLYR